MGESLGRWRARGTLHQGHDHEGKGGRAKHTGRHCAPPYPQTHIRRHLSFPPLATLWPSGLQSTAYT